MQKRYTATTEVRNNLIAAIQNVQSTQRYLNTIEFPYCKPAELETLTRAANNIYTGKLHVEGIKCVVLFQGVFH